VRASVWQDNSAAKAFYGRTGLCIFYGRTSMRFFTAPYFFLFVESSPSYGRRPVLRPVSYLFPVTFQFVQWSAETRLENYVRKRDILFLFLYFSQWFYLHALFFTAAYFFLFVESSPSYGRRPVLRPFSYLFPVTFLFVQWSAETRLENSVLLLKVNTNFSPSILSHIKILNQRLHGCILNCTLRQLIIQVQRMGWIRQHVNFRSK